MPDSPEATVLSPSAPSEPPPLFGSGNVLGGRAVVARAFPELFSSPEKTRRDELRRDEMRRASPVLSPTKPNGSRERQREWMSPKARRGSPALERVATPKGQRARLGSGGPLTPQTPGRRDGLGLGLVRQADKGTAEDKRGLCLPSAAMRRSSGTPVMRTPKRKQTPGTPTTPHDGPVGSASRGAATPKHAIRTPKMRTTPVFKTPNASRVRTPVAPCFRRDYDELREDLSGAVQTRSLAELVAALDRKHCCACSHPLHEAAKCQDVDAMRLLVSAGVADPNALCSASGIARTPLQVCCQLESWREEQRIDLVTVLMQGGADVNRPGGGGLTPLHTAARQHAVALVTNLLRAGANPNARDDDDRSVLEVALAALPLRAGPPLAGAVRVSAVEVLLAAGACPVLPEAVRARGAECPCVDAALGRAERWWRWRTLAWVHVRGRRGVVPALPQELLHCVAKFL